MATPPAKGRTRVPGVPEPKHQRVKVDPLEAAQTELAIIEVERDDLRELNAAVVAERDAAVEALAASKAGASFVSRLADAMNHAGRVEKSSVNEQQNYKYASAEAMLGAVRGPLFDRSIVLVPSQPLYRHETAKTTTNKDVRRTTVSIDFTFVDGLSDERLVIVGWQGIGEDSGDKAIGKATTSAIKTFIRTQWLLPTEHDDPEQEAPKAPPLPPWAVAVAPMVAANEINNALHDMLGSDVADMVGRKIAGKFGGTPAAALDVAHIIGRAYAHVLTQGAQTPDDEDQTPPPESDEVDAVTAARDAAMFNGEPDPGPAVLAGGIVVDSVVIVNGEEITPTDAEPGTVPNPLQAIVDAGAELPTVEQQVKLLRKAGCPCADPFPNEDAPANPRCPIVGHGQPLL